MTEYVSSLLTPLGWVSAFSTGDAIVRLSWGRVTGLGASELTRAAKSQLQAYFDHKLENFDLPLEPPGSEAQKNACHLMSDIKFGDTRTYGDLARDLGVSAQAMGQLCGRNPIPILIPCHRVLSATGLGGFSGDGGVETKVWLLRHEGAANLLI